MAAPRISVVLCTWNRAGLLEHALGALTQQRHPPEHEIVVVDNASTDGTAAIVRRATVASPAVRYIQEPRQGLSYARNTGVGAARGELIVFTDDDVRVEADWLAGISSAFERYPDAAYVGGPVEPAWAAPVPAWLTRQHWAPLGVQDYGPQPFRVDAAHRICLIGANLAFRRAALDCAGGFDPAVQRLGTAGGSTEDHELQARLWTRGLHGMYVPGLRVSAVVGHERLCKAHHRTWHYGHGRHVARMRLPEVEASAHPFFGLPGHLVRQAAVDVRSLVGDLARRDTASAFAREARLWFAAGFLRERWG